MVKIPLHQEQHTGGCQCGAIRYRITGKLGQTSVCHCRMCQKAFGSFGGPFVNAAPGALTWTRGTPAIFRSSAVVARGFCSACGTPLFLREDGDHNYEMAIGTLDNPADIPPMQHQVGVESKLPWFDAIRDLPELTTAQDRTPEDLARLKSLQHPDHDTEHWP